MIQLAKIVKIMPTRIWADKDFLGTVHIKIQHEDCPEFDFIQIQYDYLYTSNSHQHDMTQRILALLDVPTESADGGEPLAEARRPNEKETQMTQEEPSREVTGSPGAPVNAWWKLVPVAPTELMRVAGGRAVSESFMQGKDVAKMAIDAYEAMLAAAPVSEAFGSDKQVNRASQEPPVAGVRAAADAPNKG